MKKSVQFFIVLLMVAVSYNASACTITPLIIPTGTTTFCQGNGVTLSADSTYVSYLWSDGETTQSIYVTTAGNYSVYVTDGAGCTGTSAVTVVTVLTIPIQGSLSGPNPVCQLSPATYIDSVLNQSGVTYSWTLPNGWTGTSTTDIISVTVGTIGGPISVTATNQCGSSTNLTGLTYYYTGAAQTWTVPTGINNVTIYEWGGGGAGGGATTTFGLFDNGGGGGGGGSAVNTISVTSGQVYTINVGAGGVGSTGNGTNGGTSSVTGPAGTFWATGGIGGLNGDPYNGSGPGGAGGAAGVGGFAGGSGSAGNTNYVSGTGGGGAGSGGDGTSPVSACGVTGFGGTGTYPGGNGGYNANCDSTTSNNGTAGALPAGGGSGDNSWTGAYSGGAGGDGLVIINSPGQLNIVVNNTPPPAPGVITGAIAVCQNSIQTYTIAAVSGATSYVWTLPGGWSGTSTTNVITVTLGTVGGDISVWAINACGSSPATTLTVTVYHVISASEITGAASVCAGSSVIYVDTVNTGVTSYVWSLPNGWSGSSTNDTLNVIIGDSSGIISVSAMNACGTGPAATLNVTVYSVYASFVLYPDTTQLHHYYALDTISGTAPLHYLWTWGDGNQDTIANPSHTYADTGLYTICLTLTDSLGCQTTYCDSSYDIQRTSNMMAYVNVISNIMTGVKTSIAKNVISVYPNPANSTITIHQSLPASNQQLIITDVIGREIYHQILNNSNQSTIDISRWNEGVYFYVLRNEMSEVRGKFIKD